MAQEVFLFTQGSVLAAGIRSTLENSLGRSFKEAVVQSPEELVDATLQLTPAITIVDIADVNVRAFFPYLQQNGASLGKVVVASPNGLDEDTLFFFMMWDVRAHISGCTEPGELLTILGKVAQGAYLLSQDCLYQPVEPHLSMARKTSTIEKEPASLVVSLAPTPLSPRETAVLYGIAQGKTNAEIGADLGINGDIIKNHMTTIFRKLRVTNRTAAVMVALRQRWISLAAVTCTGFDRAVA